MNLLFYIYSLGSGGAERVTVNLANYWAGRGWRITVVTAATVADDIYVLNPAIARISLNLPQNGGNPGAKLTRAVKRAWALRRMLLNVKPDLAVAMMDTSCATLALAASGLRGIVPVGSLHNHPPCIATNSLFHAIQSMTYRNLAALFVLTRETAAWIAANTYARRIEVVPNPIPWPLAGGSPKLNPDSICKPGRKLLLAAGRLVPQKGFDLLIEAFAHLAERHNDWDLTILGEGPERQRIEQTISERGLGTRVKLPGWAGNMPDWYRRARLYVMSSRHEGFPNTLAEAMAHGLPAVSFNCDTGPGDIIRDGIDGFLVPTEDVPALVASLERLMSDEDLCEAFGSAAKQARDRFSMERVTQMWESVFEELLARGRLRWPRARQIERIAR
jgi:glycosyltransferase involved in cell wall biosynthesis